MDISSYISELLFGHDCVIIPNFGGFICNYKPADIHPVLHTISPPSKAISFNKNLQSNDGLLVNHIATSLGISFDAAFDVVDLWVNSSKNLLQKNEEVILKKIGKFYRDIEGNLQFTPLEEVNYLLTSYGLRTISAEPVLRGKQIDFTEKFTQETKQTAVSKRSLWGIAATVLLIISIGILGELMWKGIEIKPLHLDEAGVFSFINHVFKTPEPSLKPVAVEIKNTPVQKTTSQETIQQLPVDSGITQVNNEPTGIKEETSFPAPGVSDGPLYYVIIGAFAEEENVQAAKQRLQQKFPDSLILIERGKRITKLGYSVGNNLNKAKEQLNAAQTEDASYWLLKK